ncbi:zinc finger protein [Macleaya cordata]|uniref:Zinc finger protein n=1 Tax=Macleaya cordata TaxID=56857 RepID=A0A200PQK8_MACCD|nr:zinc finger protein [Macleaya cordata]
MSVPAPPPQFFAPFTAVNDASMFWPQVPIENEQSKQSNYTEFPPFKKPRNFEDSLSNSFQNQAMNPRMPPQNPPINRGIGRIFFKTRLCAKFKAGICPYGDNCNFAHGVEDIRKPPPNWQEIVASHEEDRTTGNWDEDQKIINRLKLCKKFCNGEECPYGDRCNFLHKDIGKCREDSTRFRESSAISIGTTGSPGSNGIGSNQPDINGLLNSVADANWGIQKPVFWKTRICIKWDTTGQCPFGEKCHFAHGQAELQKYGGQNEMETGSATIASLKCVPNSSNDAAPSSTGTGVLCKQQVQIKKCLLKWKGTKKISRIYADWIDDMPLPLSSPTNVES